MARLIIFLFIFYKILISIFLNLTDARCTPEFLSNLEPKSISDLNSGYGCASLLWYRMNDSNFLNSFNMAGTIHDYITYL